MCYQEHLARPLAMTKTAGDLRLVQSQGPVESNRTHSPSLWPQTTQQEAIAQGLCQAVMWQTLPSTPPYRQALRAHKYIAVAHITVCDSQLQRPGTRVSLCCTLDPRNGSQSAQQAQHAGQALCTGVTPITDCVPCQHAIPGTTFHTTPIR